MTGRSRWFGGWMMMVALTACGEQGGELRDATERRRAEATGADSLDGDSAGGPAPTGRVPAFVLTDSMAPARPAPAPADTARPAAQPATPPTPAADPASQQQWTAGTADRVRTMRGPVVLSDVRVGVNQGFDRVVLEFLGSAAPGYRVEYIDRPVRQCGSGNATPIAGDAWLSITLRGSQAHDERGQVTVQQRERRLQMPVIKEFEMVCDFEGVVQVVLGVSRPNRYRITELQNPTRIIVDVQQ